MRLYRAGHGQDGRRRAQLFQRYRPDRVLRCRRRRRWRRASSRSAFFVRITRELVEAPAGAHRATATCSASICGCGPIRPRPRSRSRPTRRCDYYESGGQNWERAAMIKARPCAGDHRGRRSAAARSLSPFVWRKYLDFAAIADVHAMKRQIHAYRGPRRDRGRGPQRQARPRRHPRDRVLRADPAADRRRPPSRIARPRRRCDARRCSRAERLDRRRGARRADRGLSISCAASSIACRWSPTSRPIRCRPSAEALERFRPLSRLRRPRRFRRRLCSAHLHNVAAALRQAVRERAGRARRAAELVVRRAGRRPRNARPPGAMGFQPAASRCRRRVRHWLRRRLSRAARRAGARRSHRARAGC